MQVVSEKELSRIVGGNGTRRDPNSYLFVSDEHIGLDRDNFKGVPGAVEDVTIGG